jgi:hypothetical protein
MSTEPMLIDVEPGMCWWCRVAPAESSEHKYKKSDVVRQHGSPPYNDERTLTHFSDKGIHRLHGPNSPLLRFGKAMCPPCNNVRSQPFDRAWDTLVSYVDDHEEAILRTWRVDLQDVFGSEWRSQGNHVARRMVVHAVSRIIDTLPGPHQVYAGLIQFLDGGAFPECLQLSAHVDLGVVAFLKHMRDVPVDDPRVANAGLPFLSQIVTDLPEGRSRASGYLYRWFMVYWHIGDGEASSVFAQRAVELAPTDLRFGPELREVWEATDGLPHDAQHLLPGEGPPFHALRDAGYSEVADRLTALARKRQGRSDSTRAGNIRLSAGAPVRRW